jgi:serine/threonine-protein kinase HipA
MPTIEPTELRLNFLGEPMGVLGYRADGPLHALELDASFLAKGHELSPLNLPNSLFTDGLREFRPGDTPFADGLPGLLADSLPDAWGRRMLERELPGLKTTIGKLAAIGDRGPGAITFEPALGDLSCAAPVVADLAALAKNAEALSVLPVPLGSERVAAELASGGSTLGGAFPKIAGHLVLDQDFIDRREILIGGRTPPGYTPCIVKLTRSEFSQEGAVEYAFSQMARSAGIDMPKTSLVFDGERLHFAVARFDRFVRPDNTIGRRHVHTLSGILHRPPADGGIDYEDFMRISRTLGGAPGAAECYRRAVFNILSTNRDDHGRNHAFLYNDKTRTWALAPAYDLNPSLATRLIALKWLGSSEVPQTYEALTRLASIAGIAPPKAREIYQQVEAATLGGWRQAADRSGVAKHEIEVWAREMEKATAALRQDAARRGLVRPRAAAPRARTEEAARANPSTAAELVAYLRAAREFYKDAKPALRQDTVTKGIKFIDELGGSGSTRIPLRVAAKDFVEGSGSLEVLEKRAAEHFGALLKAHVLGKNRSRGGLER